MTLAALKTKANTKLGEFWDALLIRQEAYRLLHDNYFQLLVTSPVVDGADTVWELRYASDQPAQMRTDVNFSFNSPVPFQIEVNTWGTVPSRGFSLTAVVELPDGRKFTRSRTYTDTRERMRDLLSGSEITEDAVYSDWYLSGPDPVIATSNWAEVINQV